MLSWGLVPRVVRPFACACLAMLFAVLPTLTPAHAASITILAREGDPVPGETFGEFQFFTQPILNNSGQVAFLTQNTPGVGNRIYRADGTSLTEIARTGVTLPGIGESAGISDISSLNLLSGGINGSGQIAYGASAIRTTPTAIGPANFILLGDGTTSQLYVAQGQSPSDGTGTLSRILTTSGIGNKINNSRQLVFRGAVSFLPNPNPANPFPARERGLFRTDGTTIITLAREGQSVPNGNGKFDRFPIAPALLNDLGQTAFRADLEGVTNPIGSSTTGRGIFRSDGTTVTEIVRNTDTTSEGIRSFSSLSDPVLNNLGNVAFSASSGNGSGIFRSDGTTLTQIVREGQAAPDGNGVFGRFSTSRGANPRLNDSNLTVFEAGIINTAGGSSNRSGIFQSDGTTITEVVLRGQAAPDGNGTFSSFANILLNEFGQILFSAFIVNTAGGGSSDDFGLYLVDGDEVIQVARRGQTLDGSTIFPSSTFFGDFNDLGQIAFNVTLQDSTAIERAVAFFTPDVSWRGMAGDSQWDSPANFLFGDAPGTSDDVRLNTITDSVIIGPGSDTTIASLRIGGGAGGTQLNLQNGVNLTATNGLALVGRGVLGGTGTLTGDVTVGSGGTIAPGNSPGTQLHVGNETWNGGGIFEFEVNDFLGTAGVDPGWDLLNISGTLDITASLGDPFEINVFSLAELVAGNAANFDATQDFSLPFILTGSGITGFSTDAFLLDLSGFTNSFTGTFAIEQQGNNLAVTYTPIPEPSTCVMFVVGLLGMCSVVRKRI